MVFPEFPKDRLQTEVTITQEGLYVTLSPEGHIKKHLSTYMGEVPMDETRIANELIQFSGKTHNGSMIKFRESKQIR